MQISSYPINPYAQLRSTAGSAKPDSGTVEEGKAAGPGAVEAFLTEARKTPAQRIREDLLKSMNISEDDLNGMAPEQREAVEKRIAEELQRRLTGKDAQRGAAIDLMA